jgi:polyisoprenoid-binding protein YceI
MAFTRHRRLPLSPQTGANMKKPLLIVGGLVGLLAVAVVAVIAIQLLRSDDPNLATEAPQIAIATPEGNATGSTAAAAPTQPPSSNDGAALPEGVRHFVIVPAESEAKYVVRESLRGLTTNAVGTTRVIEGGIYLTETGLSDAGESVFRVDLSTLESDEGMRDNFIKRNTLQTSRFQYATFVIEDVSGFPAGYVEDTEVVMTISGTLTVRDVSKPVTWAVKARQLGNTLTAVADLTITFQDFGMSPPSVPIATAEDEIQLQIVLVAREV